jgi:hypothetical protein
MCSAVKIEPVGDDIVAVIRRKELAAENRRDR